MTRGTFAVFVEGNIWESIEFNGDQYPSGYGKLSYTLMKGVRNLDSFQKAVLKMNENYGYDEDQYIFLRCRGGDHQTQYESLCDLSKDYVAKWFSDYLYVKNLDDEPVKVICRAPYKDDGLDEEPPIHLEIQPNEVVAFNFGHLVPAEAFDVESFADEKLPKDDTQAFSITWVGEQDDVLGNVEFKTKNGQSVVLTAEEIQTLYQTSRKAAEKAPNNK